MGACFRQPLTLRDRLVTRSSSSYVLMVMGVCHHYIWGKSLQNRHFRWYTQRMFPLFSMLTMSCIFCNAELSTRVACRSETCVILNVLQIGMVCPSENRAFLKHASNWHCENYVISKPHVKWKSCAEQTIVQRDQKYDQLHLFAVCSFIFQ